MDLPVLTSLVLHKSDGSYARNTWQGAYYLQSNGKAPEVNGFMILLAVLVLSKISGSYARNA